MIPLVVRFTGFEINPMELLQPRQLIHKPIPIEWKRVRFDVEYTDESWEKIKTKIEKWVYNNTDGRWSMYHIMGMTKRTIVIAFELDVDLVMFRLKSGETAWREKNNQY